MLAVIAAIVAVELRTIERSQQTVFTLSKLQRTARDLVQQEYLQRLGVRGFVLTLQPNESALMAQSLAAIATDFTALRRDDALAPGISALVDSARSVRNRMIPRHDLLI